jgi:cell division protein FtsB
MKILTVIFVLLIVLIQYPLFFGKGGWKEVYDLNKKFEKQYNFNVKLKKENDALKAEVNDLKRGTDAIEQRARAELGMVKKDEVFFELIKKQQ